ncbi:hypothetical protein ACQY0O_000265 [Thecaphora frezii]
MIGAWHVLPEKFYQEQMQPRADRGVPNNGRLADDVFDEALRKYPTIIYLHGNAANRAAPFRIQAYSQLTGRLHVNVVAIDYRGFGDSDGDPTEVGLVLDARAAFDFVRGRTGRGDGSGIVVFGQSLGTGVAAALTYQLYDEGLGPQAVVLMAAYSSIKALVRNFRVLGVVPLLAPLGWIPGIDALMERWQTTRFETDNHLPPLLFPHHPAEAAVQLEVEASASDSDRKRQPHLVLLHAQDDVVIPVSHAWTLWNRLVSAMQHSPLAYNKGWPTQRVRIQAIEGFGEVLQFDLDGAAAYSTNGQGDSDTQTPRATFICTLHGGHDRLSEGAVDQVGKATGLFPPVRFGD